MYQQQHYHHHQQHSKRKSDAHAHGYPPRTYPDLHHKFKRMSRSTIKTKGGNYGYGYTPFNTRRGGIPLSNTAVGRWLSDGGMLSRTRSRNCGSRTQTRNAHFHGSTKPDASLQRSTVKPWILDTIMKRPETCRWSGGPYAPFRLVDLPDTCSEFRDIESDFMATAYPFRVTKIQRVENPYLLAQFLMKKEETGMTERYLFHGTSEANVGGICKNNFNWRLRFGERRFGQGTSFSREAFYASHYGDTNTIIYARVLVDKSTLGARSTIIPPPPFDTTKNRKGTVTVKYEDDDFYPDYVIHYERFYDHFDSSSCRNDDFESSNGGDYCSNRWSDDYDMDDQSDDYYSNHEGDHHDSMDQHSGESDMSHEGDDGDSYGEDGFSDGSRSNDGGDSYSSRQPYYDDYDMDSQQDDYNSGRGSDDYDSYGDCDSRYEGDRCNTNRQSYD